MAKNGVGRQQAALIVRNLNKGLQQFAIDNGLIFVDMARVFENLDRQRLMVDFCHMTADGYRIMARTIYKELLRLNIVRGREMEAYYSLIRQYTIEGHQGFPINNW